MTRKAPPGERIHPRGPADILGARAAAAACSYMGQSRSASRPWRRRVNLVPRTLTTLTAPNKLLPSGLKLHQKNDGMEARCCHNSSGLQSLLERQGDRAGGRGAEWSCTPTRAPKVGRLHLTSYGTTIINSSGAVAKPAAKTSARIIFEESQLWHTPTSTIGRHPRQDR